MTMSFVCWSVCLSVANFYIDRIYRSVRYIHCNFCLNLHITHGDMKENVSGCFFWTQCKLFSLEMNHEKKFTQSKAKPMSPRTTVCWSCMNFSSKKCFSQLFCYKKRQQFILSDIVRRWLFTLMWNMFVTVLFLLQECCMSWNLHIRGAIKRKFSASPSSVQNKIKILFASYSSKA